MSDTADEVPSGPQLDHLPVTVLLEQRPASSPWLDVIWQATGIAIGAQAPADPMQPIREDGDSALYLVGGLRVRLFADECESYYYNLVSDAPKAYVIAHVDQPGARPQPFRVSMSFDEAHAYLEGEDEIYAVDVPAELYRWTEAFVIANYFPEKKRKRKLIDWRKDEQGTAAT